MPSMIDHVVIVVRDLERAAADYARLGFTVTPGGEHTGGGTHNALIAFADGSYLELIAFKEPDRPQDHPWWAKLAGGEGLVDYALLCEDLARDLDAARERGLDAGPAEEGGRQRPDGQRVQWRNASLPPGRGRSALPFLIEDVTPRDLRVAGPPATEHALGVTGVAGLTLATGDLAATTTSLAAALGDDGEAILPSEPDAGRATLFRVGPHWLEVIQPADDSGPVAAHRRTHSDGPFELVLRRATTDEAVPGVGDVLDEGLAHGARIRVAD